jgi:outer membrane immunogenic protein
LLDDFRGLAIIWLSVGWGGDESRCVALVVVGAFASAQNSIWMHAGTWFQVGRSLPLHLTDQTAAGTIQMKKLFGATIIIAAVGFSAAVRAADLPVYKATPAPVWDWTGAYFGGHVGYGWGQTKWIDIFPPPDFAVDADPKLNGALGGIQAGYRYQRGWFVTGIPGDFSWSGVGAAFSCFPFGNQICDAKTQWFSTLTGSIGGLINPQALIYIKGGGAVVRDQFSNMATCNGPQSNLSGIPGLTAACGVPFNADQTRLGWTAGIGFEYMFTRNWSAFAEYDYMDFGSMVVSFLGEAPNASFPELIKQQMQLVKVGFNYKLDWGQQGAALGYADDTSSRQSSLPKPLAGHNAAGTDEPVYHALAFTGVDVTSRNSVDAWAGALYSPTTDLDSFGPRIYALGGGGYYKYPSSTTGTQIKGTYETADLLGGWGLEGNNYTVNLLGGVSVENDNLSQVDPGNSVHGTQVGAKIRADAWINPTPRSLIYEEGEYSTAFNTYYVAAKGGYDFFGVGIFLGPEVAALGNDRYDQGRVGAHVTQVKFGKVQMDISGGFMHDTSVGNGGYGKVELSTNF